MRIFFGYLLALAVSFSVHAAAGPSGVWKGARLVDLLASLEENGQPVIFSNDLVGDELLILDEPDLGDLHAGLAAVLAPLGLAITSGPGGSLLIVRGATIQLAPPAAQVPDTTKALPEIIVTSSLHRLEFVHPGTQTYMDRELATRIPAAAEEAVRITNRLPGTASGGVSARNHVRGGEANEVLFLLDGLRLYEPFHLKDFQSIATIVNSNAIAGIDFYSGAYPARYGDRMSGVMSIGLREPAADMENELALSFFNLSGLSLGRFGDADQGDWLAAARRGNLDLIVDFVDPDRGSPDYRDVLLHSGWTFSDRAELAANYLLSIDEIQLADVSRGEAASARYENQVLWLKWIAHWNAALTSTTIASYSTIANSRAGSVDLPGIVAGVLDDERDFRATAIRQDWAFAPRGQWMLRFGFEVKHFDGEYQFSSTRSIAEPFDVIFDNAPLTIRDFNVISDGDQYSAYTEFRWQPVAALAIELGLRRDHQNYTTAGSDIQTSPRASVLYNVNDDTELRLGWGLFSQAQEVNELQISDGVPDYFPAQRAEHVVANIQHHFASAIDLNVSVYHKHFREIRPRFENAFNSLTVVPELQFDRVRVDATLAISVGAEITLSKGASDEALLWWLSYAWSEVEDSTPDGTQKRGWDQPHTGKAGVSWRWQRWNFSAAGEAHTGWPKTELIAETIIGADGAEQLVVATTPRNSQRHSGYYTLDARVSRDFMLKRGDLTLFLEVSNLFDRTNYCCIEYALQPGVSGAAALQSRDSHWLPLLPSLGVVWRF